MAERTLRADSLIPWGVFAVWATVAIALNWDDQLLDFSGSAGAIKAVMIVGWLGFLAYSWHCTRHENFVRSVREIWSKLWGKQIIFDLYISVFLSIAIVYIVTGSVAVTVFWSVAMIPFANQAIMLFAIIYLDRFIAIANSLG